MIIRAEPCRVFGVDEVIRRFQKQAGATLYCWTTSGPATHAKSRERVQDERLIRPDTLTFQGSDLYVTVNQLARQPNYRGGKDEREPPYVLFRLRGVAQQ